MHSAKYIDAVKGGLVIRDVVTPEEAKHISNQSFASGFHDRRVRMFAGDRERATFMDPELASLLWDRVKKFINPIRFDEDRDEYNSTCDFQPRTGMYEPTGINPFMRVSKYGPGQEFRWHKDTVFGTSNTNLGFQTLLLYLNDDFNGGGTSFRVWGTDEDATVITIVPTTGSVLLFDHAQEHQGDMIHRGCKLVLRTEVMFKPMDVQGRACPALNTRT
jgi:prolyl 4-hydroxylase